MRTGASPDGLPGRLAGIPGVGYHWPHFQYYPLNGHNKSEHQLGKTSQIKSTILHMAALMLNTS